MKLKDAAFVFYEYSIELCLTINKKYHGPAKYLLFILFAPYIFLRGIFSLLYDYTIGKAVISKKLAKENKKEFPYELGIVVIAKNEGFYIREFIEYYLLAGQGKLKIYLYDNESSDDTAEIAKEYEQTGNLTYTYFPGKQMQNVSYNDAVKNYGSECRYMAFIDMDEYIVPTENKPLPEIITSLIRKKPNAGGLGINWCMYGSSGFLTRQEGKITQTYLRRGEMGHWLNRHVKTVCNPRLVKNYISPHFPVYRLGTWSIDSKGKRQRLWFNRKLSYDEIRVHHYFCKSKEEFITKQQRGKADRAGKYDDSKFVKSDLNDIYDDRILEYIRAMEQFNKYSNSD